MHLGYFSDLVEDKLLRGPLESTLLEPGQYLQGLSSVVEVGIPLAEVGSKETPLDM